MKFEMRWAGHPEDDGRFHGPIEVSAIKDDITYDGHQVIRFHHGTDIDYEQFPVAAPGRAIELRAV